MEKFRLIRVNFKSNITANADNMKQNYLTCFCKLDQRNYEAPKPGEICSICHGTGQILVYTMPHELIIDINAFRKVLYPMIEKSAPEYYRDRITPEEGETHPRSFRDELERNRISLIKYYNHMKTAQIDVDSIMEIIESLIVLCDLAERKESSIVWNIAN